ncbi:hypothetical protein [Breznakiella homolactica]|uniref:Uncharacterized protein n=1 Tax=Breznakiella homolactica TaxID=2798577 RepID=A0A7T8BBB9_9SPIR|nr:hypothetical protein [Breznakiella homolactica]QQO10397.1 hypothetical protein JFL75_05615 [Breznakiella homolactica]
MKNTVLIVILVLILTGLILFVSLGFKTVNTEFGYFIKDKILKENLERAGIKIDVTPMTRISDGFVKILNDTRERIVLKQPYQLSITLDNKNTDIDSGILLKNLSLYMGKTTINLSENISEIRLSEYTADGIKMFYSFTDFEIEETQRNKFIDLRNRGENPFLITIVFNDTHLKYDDIKNFNFEFEVDVKNGNDVLNYSYNIQFERKKKVDRVPVWLLWLLKNTLYRDFI